jgi:hypothetical protein
MTEWMETLRTTKGNLHVNPREIMYIGALRHQQATA